MRKINKVIFPILLSAMIFSSSCSNERKIPEHVLENLCFTTEELSYDFEKGISFVEDNGKYADFTIESNVVFGTPGQYQVKYLLPDATYIRNVFIYGQPEISIINPNILYVDAMSRNFSANIKAVDTFGLELEFICLSEFAFDSCGMVLSGNQDLVFKTSDSLGNSTEKTLTLNVLESDGQIQERKYDVDYSKPYLTLDITGKNVRSVYFKEQKLTSDYYLVNNGYLMLTPNLIRDIGKDNSGTVYVNFDSTTFKLILSVTDNKPASYEFVGTVEGQNYYLDDKISVPTIRLKNSSIQNITAKYFVKLFSETLEITNSYFEPTNGGSYNFISEVYRDSVLIETKVEKFLVGHFYKKPVDLGECVGVNNSYDISVRTDLEDINVKYSLQNNDGVLQIDGNFVKALKEGNATFVANINNGELIQTIDVTAIDFKNKNGGVRDFSLNTNIWESVEESVITNEIVSDIRTQKSAYEFNAVVVNGKAMIPSKVIEAAKVLGYKHIQFDVCVGKENESFNVFAINNEEKEPLINEVLSGKWTYFDIPLKDIGSNFDVLFVSSTNLINIAKVEFIGADISEYAQTCIKESSTDGRSTDLINNDTIFKLFGSTCNANNSYSYTDTGLDRNGSTDNGDYFTYSRTGFYGSYGNVENNPTVNSEWILAAKKLGYSTIGMYVWNSGYKFLKRCADTSVLEFTNGGKEWHAGLDKWSFISLDLTSFEEGDCIIISCSDTTIKLSGVTFRTASYGEPNLKI